jgi:peptide/nickel transport system substrate-binding protein
MKRRHFLLGAAGALWAPARAWAEALGSAYFADLEKAGELPPIADRLPVVPAVADMAELGRHGGEIRMLMASPKDTRVLVAYSYARLVGYDRDYHIAPDILERCDVEGGRVFTMRLRQGHKWSDGEPFTAEAFRYYWEDVANNADLSPVGPPKALLVDGAPPTVEFLDDVTIRYSWEKPNAEFLPALAGTTPLFIFRPGHYLKKYHVKYQKPKKLEDLVAESGQPSWAALHNRKDNQYRNDNPKLPTLDPWMLRIKPPAERFVFTRNPYYYRVDRDGRQLPYLDQVVFDIADGKLIPAKTGAGDSDLQARNIRFDNYTFLKDGEINRQQYWVRLWDDGRGSNFALYPNLTANDETWRKVNRDVRFRRALSLGVNRHEINQAIYYGLGLEGANSVLPSSPLHKPEYRDAWAAFDLKQANALLDEMGLTQRGDDGLRLLPDGRPMIIIVDTAGESTEESDILELIRDSWRRLGIDLFTKPSQREVFRNRVFAGDSIMATWSGVDNGFPNADMSPWEFCPSTQQQLHWAKWGQFIETGGEAGEEIDIAEAKELAGLLEAWRASGDTLGRAAIWARALEIWADQVYTIGTVANVPQPVVVNRHVHNVPEKAMFAWEPGAHFGVYKPDTFWLDEDRPLSVVEVEE